MSIGNCETIDLNNSRINTTNATNSTHETNDLSLSINSTNLNTTSKISNTGISSEQTTSSTAKTNNGENMNKELIEEKKRKLRLPLVITSDDQTNCNITSSDSINDSNSNSAGFLSLTNDNGIESNISNKKLKATYFDNGSLLNLSLVGALSNETPCLNSKELVKCLDNKCNTLSTPQLEKLIHDLNPNIKTPSSGLALLGSGPNFFTPGTEMFITSIAGDLTPGLTMNPSVLFSNPQLGATTTTGAASAAAVVIAPSISGATANNINSNNNNSNTSSANTSNYAMLTNVSNTFSNTGNFLLIQNGPVEMTDKNQTRLDYNMLSNKSLTTKDEKDNNFLQTVPVHPPNLPNDARSLNTNNNTSTTTSNNINNNNNSNNNRGSPTSTQSKSRGKPASKTTKSASIKKSSDSFSDLMTSTPNPSTFSGRRDTGNSTTSSSSNLDTSFSPINLDNQEALKQEKKRARNREAARKCRTRKLEKIATLEIQVKTLTENNEIEKAKTDKLREEINLIRMKLEQHKKIHKCDLNLAI